MKIHVQYHRTARVILYIIDFLLAAQMACSASEKLPKMLMSQMLLRHPVLFYFLQNIFSLFRYIHDTSALTHDRKHPNCAQWYYLYNLRHITLRWNARQETALG